MKKKILAAVIAATMTFSGVCPVGLNIVPVAAKTEDTETAVAGTWYGNIWGTPAVMTLGKDQSFSIKYDNEDNTELSGEWKMKDGQIIVNEGTDEDLLIDYDEKKETLTTQSNGEEFVFTRDKENSKKKTVAVNKNAKESDFTGVWKVTKVDTDSVLAPADVFGVNSLFLSVKDQKIGLYMDIDNTDGVIDISDLSSEFSDGVLSFVIGGGAMDEAAEAVSDNENGEYQDISCTAQMLEDGTMKLTFSDSTSVRFIMEKSTEKEMKDAKKAAAEKTEDQEKSEESNSDKNNKEEK